LGPLPHGAAIEREEDLGGAGANLIGSSIVAVLFAGWLGIDPWQCLLMAALANIAGQVGDLLDQHISAARA